MVILYLKRNERRLVMSVIKVNKESFETEVLKAEGIVLVDFFADWCGPCKMLSPVIDQIAEEQSGIKVCKVNVDNEPELAMKYGVMSIPTLVVMKNGNEVNKSVGLVSKEEILDLIK